MSDADLNFMEYAHCPVCEYNLHGNTTGRCPECGSTIGPGSSSRLPWIYRRARGGIRAYAQMLGLLILRPWRLNAEKKRRVARQPAARFHHESIALATILGAGLLAIAFLLRGPRWDELVSLNLYALLANSPDRALLWLPMIIWNDQLVILIPLVPTLYISLYVTTWSYRRMIRHINGPTTLQGRRASRIGYYASGLAPVLAVLFGLLCVLAMLIHEELDAFLGGWGPIIREFRPLIACLAIAIFSFPTAFLLFQGKGKKVGRALLALTLFPILQFATWTIIGFSLFWIIGYATLALWSMTH